MNDKEIHKLNLRIDALRARLEKLENETKAARKTITSNGQDLRIEKYSNAGQIVIG